MASPSPLLNGETASATTALPAPGGLTSALLKSGGLCEKCVTGFAHGGKPAGTLGELAPGMQAYFAPAPPAALARDAPTLLMVPDVFGIRFVNTQLLADSYAALGLHVVVADVYAGRSMVGAITAIDRPGAGFFSKLGGVLYSLPAIISFFNGAGDKVVTPRARVAAEAARARAESLGNGRLAAAGYCWGGRFALGLGSGPAPLVDAWVACHSGFVDQAKLDAAARPGLVVVPERTHSGEIQAIEVEPIRARHAAAAAAAAAEGKPPPFQPLQLELYANVDHGFTTRCGPEGFAMRDKAVVDVADFVKKALAKA